MKGFVYSTILQWRLDFRNKSVLLIYYLVPLLFYIVFGSVLSSIDEEASKTIIQTMIVFAISMAAFIGTPMPLVEMLTSDAKKAYKVGNVPIWSVPITAFISGLIHIFIVSMIILVTAPFIFSASLPSNLFLFIISLFLLISVSLLIAILIAFASKNQTTLMMFGQFFFMPSVLLGGLMFSTDLLPRPLQIVGQIFPATHGMKILTETASPNFLSYLPLLIIGIIAYAVITYIYQKTCKRV